MFTYGKRVATRDNNDMGVAPFTGTVAAVDDNDASAVLVDWDHQRIAYNRGTNFIHDWTDVNDLVLI